MKLSLTLSRSVAFFLAAVVLAAASASAQAELTPAQEKALRKKAVERQRRIIFNNDGNEPVYYMTKADPEELLSLRTAPLAGTQVDSVFYCTWSSGFSLFTHETKVGRVFDFTEGIESNGKNLFAKNVTRQLVDQGNDPLKIVAKFCRERGMEIFWSMRMNDTHDGYDQGYGPVMFRLNKLKNDHPEWLIGSRKQKPPYGAWSAVDYARPEIRDLAFRYLEEVCQKYQVDGVELDFFRHPVYFKSAAGGSPSSQAERDMMTDLVRRVRRMTEVEGSRRDRPILLAVRVPDSVDFCRQIGLDLEKWLEEGLVDLLVTSGYFQLNDWQYSVDLGHKYGVKVYPSLDESRVQDPEAGELRRSIEAYRARATNVWNSGADGVYLFNYADLFQSKYSLMSELGSRETLKGLDKRYFASFRGLGGAAGGTLPHRTSTNIPTLNPAHPLKLIKGDTVGFEFPIGEDIKGSEKPPKLVLSLWFANVGREVKLDVRLNGEQLVPLTTEENQRTYSLKPSGLKRGPNQIDVQLQSPAGEGATWTDLNVAVDY